MLAFIVSSSCKQKSADPVVETTISSLDSIDKVIITNEPEVIDNDVATPTKTEPDNTSTQKETEKRNYETDMLHGTMMIKGNDWIIRSDDSGEQKDYFPTNLTDEFKVEGLTVGFKGTVQEIPKNVRMVGAPIELSKIIKMQIMN